MSGVERSGPAAEASEVNGAARPAAEVPEVNGTERPGPRPRYPK